MAGADSQHFNTDPASPDQLDSGANGAAPDASRETPPAPTYYLVRRTELYGSQNVTIGADELSETDGTYKTLEITSTDGTPFLSLRQNPIGNKGEKNYTATFLLGGYKLLLPIPFTAGIGTNGSTASAKPQGYFDLQIDDQGDVSIKNNNNKGTNCTVLEHIKSREQEANEDKESILMSELSPEWQSIDFSPNEYLTLYGQNEVLGYAFRMPQTNMYVLRRHPNHWPIFLEEDKVYDLDFVDVSEILDIHLRIGARGLELRGSSKIGVSLTTQPPVKKIELGQSGLIEAYMNGGRKFAGATTIYTANSYFSKYENLNGDSLGVNIEQGIIVEADGIGSPGNESHASALATETIASRNKLSLPDRLGEAYSRLAYLNSFYSGQKTCDTVLTAAKIEGDDLEPACLGDSKWYLVRNGKIVARSRERSIAGERYEAGLLGEQHPKGNFTLYEKLTSLDHNNVTTSLLTNFDPDYTYLAEEGGKWVVKNGKIKLQPGDRFVQVSDGADALTDEEIVQSVSGVDPATGVSHMLDIAEERNKAYSFMRDFHDGNGLQAIHPPFDNITISIYAHD